MYDICCVGHITLDKVITPNSTVYMAGGTSFYFSNALSNMDTRYILVTSLAEKEIRFAEHLRSKGIEVNLLPSAHTVYFENIYPENQDHRTQRVIQKADPFTAAQLAKINAKIFHLGPLLADDIPAELIRDLATRGLVSLDVQGYLREVRRKQVCAIDWPDKKEVLQHIHFLKASRDEMQVLTGTRDVRKGALMLYEWGVKEVLITLGSKGSVIYKEGIFYSIPAFKPATAVVDATGCGDTYMAGYLYQRINNADTEYSGEFAAAMATLKIESSGPFTGTKEDVMKLLDSNKKRTYADEI